MNKKLMITAIIVIAMCLPFVLAVWGGGNSISDNLGAYWPFDNVSDGTEAIDSLSIFNFTVENNWTTGKLSFAQHPNGTRANTTVTVTNFVSLSYNFWLYKEAATNNEILGTVVGAPASNGQHTLRGASCGGDVTASFGVDLFDGVRHCFDECVSVGVATWEMFSITLNSTSLRIYKDGALGANCTLAGFTPKGVVELFKPSGTLSSARFDEFGIWNKTLNESEVSTLYSSGSALSYPFTGGAITSLAPPDGTSGISPVNFNCSTGVTDGEVQNMSLWTNQSGTFQIENYTIGLNGTSNSTTWNHGFTGLGSFLWSCSACDNSGVCLLASSNRTITINTHTENSRTFNTSVYETGSESFIINITHDSTNFDIAAIFNYNNVNFTTTQVGSGDNIAFTSTLNMESVIANTSRSFYWIFDVTGGDTAQINTSLSNQTVGNISLSLCGGAGGTNRFLNISFKNETISQEETGAFISESTFNFWIDDSTNKQNFTFSNVSENAEYNFCALPAHEPLNVDVSLSYDNAESQQRNYNPNTLTLTNQTTNTTLYLLPTSDGIFVTFQVINAAEQPVEGALVELSRTGFGVIAQQTTGASGTVSIFLNPNFIYGLSVSATGFATFTASQTFPTTEFTVQLGAQEIIAPNNYLQGINFIISPRTSILNNNTLYHFNFTVNSTFWSLEEWGFDLKNRSGFVLNSTSATTPATGGIVLATLNTGNITFIQMDYFWKINGSYINGTIAYGVFEPSDGSIKGFFDRLSLYLSQGIFGINQFGIALITFLIIFISVGILSFKFGLNSPEAIMVIGFFIVALFDAGFGLIPIPFVGSLPGFPTLVMGLIVVAFWLRRNRL